MEKQRYIEMTDEQTSIYDGGDESASRALIRELRSAAGRMRMPGQRFEIYTADGICVDVVQ